MKIVVVCVYSLLHSAYSVFQAPIGPIDAFSKCYNKADFDALCTQQFYGFVDGNQCYFAGSRYDVNGWSGSWATCAAVGGRLAQFYTESEYSKLVNYLRAVFSSGYVAIALQDASSINPPCVLESSTVYFYDDASTPNTLFPVFNNTCVGRKLACGFDSGFAGSPRCMYLGFYTNTYIFDDSCQKSPACVCQGSNVAHQGYTLSIGCMAETPIQTVSIATPQECGNVCTSKRWCRSFNFLLTAGSHCTSTTANCSHGRRLIQRGWSVVDQNVIITVMCHNVWLHAGQPRVTIIVTCCDEGHFSLLFIHPTAHQI